MADPFRGGGFGGGGFGPFKVGGGGFGQYNIGGSNDGQNLAALDKQRAANAWRLGQLTDAAYLAALQKYVNSTDAGTSSRESAQNELKNATISIGRQKIVRAVNKTSTPGGRIRELLRLIRYDRKTLKTMKPGNDAYRDQLESIQSLQADVRSTRYGRIQSQYQNGQLTNQEMLDTSRRFAAQSQGKPDHRQYRDQVRMYADRLLTEQIREAEAAWNEDPSAGNAAAVDKLFAKQIARNKPGSPSYKDSVKFRENFQEKVTDYDKQVEKAITRSKYRAGELSGQEWLDFMHQQMAGEDRGTPEYIRARDEFNQEAALLTEKYIQMGIDEGSRTTGDLIDFYNSQMFWMDPMSPQALDYQQKIAGLSMQGYENFNTAQPGRPGAYAGAAGGGHVVYPGQLAPGGRPVNKAGFASQFDGSAFANTNCAMASGAMLAWAVSGGDVKVSGGDMRYYSGDREGGTHVGNVNTALDAVGIDGKAFHGNLSLGGFRKRLKNGKPAVLSGVSGATARELQMGYTGDHSIYVDHVKEKNGKTWYFVRDPLGRAGHKGRYWDEENIRRFGFANGRIEGFALFAGKGGHTKKSKRMGKTEPPPQQSFDTDWKGEGTQGRGGGTNRAEAGPQQDWSGGKPTRRGRNEELIGTDEATISTFLATVGRIEERTRQYGEQEGMSAAEVAGPTDAEDARRNRAEELLFQNGGDPRMAAVEWFTGIRPDADVASWSQTARHYANAVAKPMGLDKVEKGDVLMPGSPEQPIAAGSGEAPLPPGELTAREQKERAATGGVPSLDIDPDAERMSRDLLDRLGIPATNEAVRMTASWLIAENGGGQAEGFNPLNLKTMGNSDLPGQIGRAEDGTANFDTYDEGLDATADIMEQDAPAVLGALRSNDPEAFADALADSEWSDNAEYGNLVTQAYNTLPNIGRPIISNTGSRTKVAPVSLANASTSAPSLVELLDVDFNDPHQRAWFSQNADAVELAMQSNQATWSYEAPDGSVYEVPTTRGVLNDVLTLNMEYVNATAPETTQGIAQMVAADQRLNNTLAEVDFRNYQRELDGLQRQRKAAERQGRWGDALDLEDEMVGLTNSMMQQEASAPLDIYQHKNSYLSTNPTAWKYVSDTIDSLEPFTGADASDPSTVNTRGSRIRALVRDGLLHEELDPETGARVIAPAPGVAFVTVDEQGNNKIITKQTDPELFEPTTTVINDPATNEPLEQQVPVYASPDSGWVQVMLSDGSPVRLQPTIEENPLITFYNREFEGVSKEIVRTMNPEHTAYMKGLQMAQMQGGQEAVRDYEFEQWKKAVGQTEAFGRMPSPGSDVTPPQYLEEERTIRPSNDDALLAFGGIHPGGQVEGMPTVQKLSYVDPTTGQPVTGWSIDESQWIWRFGEQEATGSPPAFVVDPPYKVMRQTDDEGNVSYTFDGVGDDPDWGEIMVPYGSPDDQTGNPIRAAGDFSGIGGKGLNMLIKESAQGPDGQQVIDAAFTTAELYRTDQIGVAEAMARAQGEQAQQLLLSAEGVQEGAELLTGSANVLSDAEQRSSMPDELRTMLGVPPTGQTAGPNAGFDLIDPNLAMGMQASAAAGELSLAEQQAKELLQEQNIREQRAAAEAAAPAVVPQPATSGKGLDPGQFADSPYKGGQGGVTKPLEPTPGPQPGPPPRRQAPPPPSIESAMATLNAQPKKRVVTSENRRGGQPL